MVKLWLKGRPLLTRSAEAGGKVVLGRCCFLTDNSSFER